MAFASAQEDIWRDNSAWSADSGLTWTTSGADTITSSAIRLDKDKFDGAITLAVNVDIVSGSGTITFELQRWDGIGWHGSGANTFKRADDYSQTTASFQSSQEGYDWHYNVNVVSSSSESIERTVAYLYKVVAITNGAVTANIKTFLTDY